MAQDDYENPYGAAGADAYPNPYLAAREPSAIGGVLTNEQLKRWGLDVVNQIPGAVASTVEAAAAFPAVVGGAVGGLANTPEQEAQRQAGLDVIKQQRLMGEPSQYLPKPETLPGALFRGTLETALSTAAGARPSLSLPRALGVGATAGLTGEAAGQAVEGTAAEPAARIGGTLLAATMAGKLAQGAQAKTTADKLTKATEAAANRGYDQFRASGFSLDPTAGPTYSQFLKQDLTGRGLTSKTAGRAWDVLDEIEKTPFTNPTQFQDRYKELGSIAKAAKDSEERLAANIAKERLLNFLESPPAWVVQGGDPAKGAALLREANANWAAAKRSENLSQRINKAELKAGGTYSGLNLENQLRQRVGVLADPAVRGGFSPDEQKAFADFAKGNLASNAPRWIKNLIGGGGGLGTLAAGGAAVGLGQSFGLDPLTAAGATTLAGLGLAKYGNAAALGRARDLQLRLLERAPLAAGRSLRSQPTLPLYALPPSLATLGEGQ